MTSRPEEIPLTENPAFDGSYDTFAENRVRIDDAATESTIVQGDNPDDHQITVEDDGMEKPDANQLKAELEELTTDMLTDELPSTTLRRMKGMARPGSVKQRRVVGADDLFVDQDGDSSELTPATLRQRSLKRLQSAHFEVEDLDQIDASRVNRMTVDMNTKKTIRRQASKVIQPKRVSRWKQFKFATSLRFKSFKNSVKDSLTYVDLWDSHFKKIQGVFGTGVLSYFVLLRWLFLLNLLITFLNLMFLFVPQIVHDPSTKRNNLEFTGLELLTGEGWLKPTELYYGGYTNESIPVKGSTPYRMPLAYLFVGGGYALLCLVVLLKSMASSYRKNFIIGDDSGVPLRYFVKVFCSWDYGITDKSASLLKTNSIYNDLMETLNESKRNQKLTTKEKCTLISIRILTNIVALALLCGSVYLIIYVAGGSVKVDTSVLQDMLPALVISGLNLVIPYAFRIVASLEAYESPQTELAMSLARTILLKLSSITVYVVALHRDITCKDDNSSTTCKKLDCWETFVGAAFYKLVVVDFLFLLVAVFFGEFVRRLLAVYIPFFKERIGVPGFDISRNVLDLIYAQGICWVGTFYSPLLPLVNLVKLFLLFYIKRYSVMKNCRPSMRPFNASKMNVLFLALLGLTLLLALIVTGYVIINDGDLKPSSTCGPFRGRPTIYSIVIEVIDNDIPDLLEDIIETIASVSVLVALTFLLGLLAYYFRLKKKSGYQHIKLLKEQIALAGRDKLFLMRKLRSLMAESTPQPTITG